MENKLYLVGIKCSLSNLANRVQLIEEKGVKHIAYMGFWENIVFFEYNQDTHEYIVKEVVDNEIRYYSYEKETDLFHHMDNHGIEFVYDIPMGEIFQSYSAAYLEVVRWAGDICWTREYFHELVGEQYGIRI